MNRENWEESNADCNVCGDSIEVGSASSRCSNRHCPTRDRDIPLSTDSNAQDVYEYFDDLDFIERERIDNQVRNRYRDYRGAPSADEMDRHEKAINGLIDLSSYIGWGDIKEDVE